MRARDEMRANAERALRIPDLEWAHDLVHQLARDVLTLAPETRDQAIEDARIDGFQRGLAAQYRAVKDLLTEFSRDRPSST